MESWKIPVIFILIYSLVTITAWNVVLTFEQPAYENALVLDKRKVNSGGRHGVVSYFLTVETEKGEVLHQAQIHGGLYGQVEAGEQVTVSWNTSALGITYYEVQE